MVGDYKLVSSVLRRSRISKELVDRASALALKQEGLEEILRSYEVMDVCPDSLPPQIIGEYIRGPLHRGVDFQEYVVSRLGNRKVRTGQQILRSLRSSSKADATRRTTITHPVTFADLGERDFFNLEDTTEKTYVFLEKFAQDLITKGVVDSKVIFELLEGYSHAKGFDVPSRFFDVVRFFSENGAAQRIDRKHKYPLHSVVYGKKVDVSLDVASRIEQAGNIFLDALCRSTDGNDDTLFFSVDFFLDAEGRIYLSRDVHDIPIGMGIQEALGAADSSDFFDAYCLAVSKRARDGAVALSHDSVLISKNKIYGLEFFALRDALRSRGLEIRDDADFVLRSFGGTEGNPGLKVSSLVDDKTHIDYAAGLVREELGSLGVYVPEIIPYTVSGLVESSSLVQDKIGSRYAFVHPKTHRGFKPFEVDLDSKYLGKLVKGILASKGDDLRSIQIDVQARAPNYLPFEGKEYASEMRCYFVRS